MSTRTHEPMDRTQAEALFSSLSEEALARRRRARRLSIVATSLIAALILGGFTWALGSLSPLTNHHEAPATISPFDPRAFGTYVFSHVRVKPWIPPGTSLVDPHRVGVTGRATWSGAQFPGMHECHWSVFDAEGAVVGTYAASQAILTSPFSSQYPMSVKVSGDPRAAMTAKIACDPARLDMPVAYQISNERVSGKWGGDGMHHAVWVRFDIGWPVQAPQFPGVNWCEVTLALPSGELVKHKEFSMSAPAGPGRVLVTKKDFTDLEVIPDPGSLDARVSCVPYSGQVENPRA